MNKKFSWFTLIPSVFLLLLTNTTQAGDIEEGRIQATKCAICHGINGKGNGAPKSNISGMEEDLFIKHINDFRSGIRKNVMMQRFTKNLSDEDIENLAAYFGSK